MFGLLNWTIAYNRIYKNKVAVIKNLAVTLLYIVIILFTP